MSKKIKDPQRSGRAWAYVGTILGVVVSSAANAAETWTNPDVPEEWQRAIAFGMGLLPVGLFVALEVLVRNRIKDHLNWWRGAMLLAAVSFAVPSYSHMHDLLERAGQNDLICIITPLGWDSMMLLSTLALLLPPGYGPVVKPVAALTAHGEPWLAMQDEMRAWTAEVAAGSARLDAMAAALEEMAARPVVVQQAPQVPRQPRRTAPTGERKRLKPTEYPFWDDFATAQAGPTPWDDERMLKELRGLRADATTEAARSLRKRWVQHFNDLTSGREV